MPLGWERINAKKSQPNKNIVFIKPRPGPDEATSKDYLERIAAQCLPIMNKYHLTVVSLEEYEPNLEFWGRNFNNGEVIQIVLKSPSTGHWLPMKFIQMVMMHELAHCKQMNHSKAFWAVRNKYTADMKILWDRGYTGEGLWGKGLLLENGSLAREIIEEGEILPVHICGGTFKSRGSKKRKGRPKIPYKERHEQRIKKKFGENGMALGADDNMKAKLESGKRPAGKPRVAGSTRGRELRAAAALARFEMKEKEKGSLIKNKELATNSEVENDTENEAFIDPELDDAIDINGKRLLDRNGQGMVRVCGKENMEEVDAENELHELQIFSSFKQDTRSVTQLNMDEITKSKTQAKTTTQPLSRIVTQRQNPTPAQLSGDTAVPAAEISSAHSSCLVCSFVNGNIDLICAVCSNVLKPEYMPDAWRCQTRSCKDRLYMNSGDSTFCGICASKRE